MGEQLVTSPKRHVTYLGVPATVYDIATSLNAIKRLGTRVGVIRWEADAEDQNGVRHAGDVTVTAITGDGRKADHTIHARTILEQADDAMVMAWAAEIL